MLCLVELLESGGLVVLYPLGVNDKKATARAVSGREEK